jgi:hypothetical protein
MTCTERLAALSRRERLKFHTFIDLLTQPLGSQQIDAAHADWIHASNLLQRYKSWFGRSKRKWSDTCPELEAIAN